MSPTTLKVRRIMELLKAVYLADRDKGVDLGGEWQERVMATIRREKLGDSPPFLSLLGQLAWRLAPATCSLTVVLAVLSVKSYLSLHYDLLRLLMNHAEDLMFAQLLGM